MKVKHPRYNTNALHVYPATSVVAVFILVIVFVTAVLVVVVVVVVCFHELVVLEERDFGN